MLACGLVRLDNPRAEPTIRKRESDQVRDVIGSALRQPLTAERSASCCIRVLDRRRPPRPSCREIRCTVPFELLKDQVGRRRPGARSRRRLPLTDDAARSELKTPRSKRRFGRKLDRGHRQRSIPALIGGARIVRGRRP